MKRLICLLSVCVMAVTPGSPASGEEGEIPPLILGAYAHPKSFWDKGARLDEHGVNAVFIHSGGIDDATLHRARDEGCKVFAEFATLNGQYGDYVYEHPEARPLDDDGSPVEKATWFLGACPTEPGFRAYRMKALREFLTRYDVDGVWMDYLHWHAQFEDPYPIFVKTCFNETCLTAFQQATGLQIPGDTVSEKSEWIFMNAARQWEDWRVSVLVDWAREIHGIVKELRPDALVGNYQVAWKDEDLGGVRRRCLGLDFGALRPYVDVYSPMIYHGRSGKTPEYVKEYVEYFSEYFDIETEPGKYPRLWPIVQAHDEPRIEPEELARVLEYGLGARAARAS